MTRYLLDTNVVSNLVSPRRSANLIAWLSDQSDRTLFIASMTVAEINRGILQMPHGRKRERLEMWFDGPEGPLDLFEGRVLPFDREAALIWAALMAEGKSAGRPRDAVDMIIAAVARANGCVVVTDNERDFAGLDYVNPLKPSGTSA